MGDHVVYWGNVEESVVANSLKTEGMIENCLPMTGGGGVIRILQMGGVGGVIKILQICGGGRESGKYFHDTTKILQSASPSPPLPSPPRQ